MSHASTNQFNEVAEVYDSLMSVVPYRWWVEYVRRLWRQFDVEPRRVLDLACGTGNVLLELLSRGYEGEGVDNSAAMLRIAERKLGGRARLWCQDARKMVLPSAPFDGCVCLFDSLNYLLKPEELGQAFRAIHRHLVPGGSLVFDMNAIHALEAGMFDQRGTGEDSSLEYEWHSAWEPRERLCTIQMEFRVSDELGVRVFQETHTQRGYEIDEVRRALAESGFEVLAVFSAFTMHSPTARTDRLYYVARASE
jgi:SAM-dependent methyltransferase